MQRFLARPRWYVALELWAIAVVVSAIWQIIGKLHVYQWDVIVYWWGGRAFAHGQSPYGAIPGQPEYLHFVYPPLLAAVFAPLSMLNVSATKLLWFALKAVAFWTTVRIWRRAIGPDRPAVPPIFFFTFAFGSAVLVDFTAGNIAVFEQLALWIGFAALLAGRPLMFTLAIVLAAQFKLTPVFFLGLLLVIGERPRWVHFVAGVALFLALAGANVVALPVQTREFFASVTSLGERGWGNPSTLGVMEDLVDQLRGLRLPFPLATAYALYLAAVAGVLHQTVRWWRAARSRGSENGAMIVLVTLTVYALVMPRMKDYSYVALLPVAWYVLSGPQMVTASLAVLAVLVPRPLPQLKLWLPLVPQAYTYAPLLGAFVLWSILTTVPEPLEEPTPLDDQPLKRDVFALSATAG
ncbi:MAG: glycosyltransferase family 87 protein [Gemmatimonadaceae bacterium]